MKRLSAITLMANEMNHSLLLAAAVEMLQLLVMTHKLGGATTRMHFTKRKTIS